MADQVYRSGTSIGANISEAIKGHSKRDFVAKLQIAFKEAGETEYWLESLFNTGYLTEKQYGSIKTDCIELIKLLTSILNTSKQNL